MTRKTGLYANYKLTLALLAADRLGRRADVPQGLVERLLALQERDGGWVTDYRAGGRPVGRANVETTCLAVLALERWGLRNPVFTNRNPPSTAPESQPAAR